MTVYEALTSEGHQVRVTGYRPARIGTIVGKEWCGRPRGGRRAFYVQVDCGPALGIIGYKPKYLVPVS